jgi:hypothetical protein
MMDLLKRNVKFILFLTIFGLLGGYFTGLYSVETLSPEMLEQVVQQVGSVEMVILITTAQSLLYGLACGLLGKVFAKKVGLWRENWTLERKTLISAAIVGLITGCALILFDLLWFGNEAAVIRQSYEAKPSLNYMIASLTYGGVIEEVMLRLFLMSLIAFVLQKLFARDKKEVPPAVLITANVIAALLFAAGHLPATVMSIGLNPIIIFRCFLLNGGAGLLFGRLYRKYGIHYAMLGHGLAHVVSKLIWILFV